jgi:hypothetical protein
MFNETTYLGQIPWNVNSTVSAVDTSIGNPKCEAIKASCLSQYPDDGSAFNSPVNQALDQCLSSAGYYSSNGCFQSTSYANPGSTTYYWDLATNPQNPNSPLNLLPKLDLTTWLLIGGAAFFLLTFAGRR